MRPAAARAGQALLIAMIPLIALAALWPAALRLPQVWMAVAVGVAANILQPSYSPFEGQRTREDGYTGVQIVWTVYSVQAAAVVELLLRRPDLKLDWVSWAALGAMLFGLGLRTWAVATLGRWFTWNVQVQEDQLVIDSGPYRLVRHPSYAGALVTYVGFCVLFHSWIAAGLAVIALTLAFRRRIAREEALLRERLPEYQVYMERTGALFPSLRGWLTRSGRSVTPS